MDALEALFTMSLLFASQCGLVLGRWAGKQKGLGLICLDSPFSSKNGHCLVTLLTQSMKH